MSDGAAPQVHPTAIVEDGAVLGVGVVIGPFCHVGPQVRLGDNARLVSHVALHGDTHVGSGTRIFPFASIGHEPQDLKYAGEPVTLRIGNDCTIREGVTVNPGTAADKGETNIGDRSTLLANSHVAHDCVLGNGIILSNNVMIAGHCHIGDHVIFGGGSAVHQFSRVGRNAFIGGLAGLEGDLVPFGMAMGNRASLRGLNVVGMKRSGMAREAIHAMRGTYKAVFTAGAPIQDAVAAQREGAQGAEVLELLDFIAGAKDRALCTPA